MDPALDNRISAQTEFLRTHAPYGHRLRQMLQTFPTLTAAKCDALFSLCIVLDIYYPGIVHEPIFSVEFPGTLLRAAWAYDNYVARATIKEQTYEFEVAHRSKLREPLLSLQGPLDKITIYIPNALADLVFHTKTKGGVVALPWFDKAVAFSHTTC